MSPFAVISPCYIVLATFERGTDDLGVLSATAAGACGWIGVRVTLEDEVVPALDQALAEIGLRLIEVERVIEVHSIEEVAGYDDHLAMNMESWEAGRITAWGTIHSYVGDGEA